MHAISVIYLITWRPPVRQSSLLSHLNIYKFVDIYVARSKVDQMKYVELLLLWTGSPIVRVMKDRNALKKRSARVFHSFIFMYSSPYILRMRLYVCIRIAVLGLNAFDVFARVRIKMTTASLLFFLSTDI